MRGLETAAGWQKHEVEPSLAPANGSMAGVESLLQQQSAKVFGAMCQLG